MPEKNSSFDMAIFKEILEELIAKNRKNTEEGARAEVSLSLLFGVYMERADMADMSKTDTLNRIIGELDKADIAYNRKTAIALLGIKGEPRPAAPSLKKNKTGFGPGSTGIEKSNPDK